jgi:hypothetical protein
VADSIFKAPPVPALDRQCRFPWFGVAGCKGKDPNAMLRLTVSDDVQLRSQLGAGAGWYRGIRSDYQAGK